MGQQDSKQPKGGGFARTLRTALLIVALILGAITVWAWVSSNEDRNLPFNYEGFD